VLVGVVLDVRGGFLHKFCSRAEGTGQREREWYPVATSEARLAESLFLHRLFCEGGNRILALQTECGRRNHADP
jgi:hypothetical protein